MMLSVALAALGERAVAQGQLITIVGASGGRVFDGIGGVSGGGSSRLLIDYPEPYRSRILDYLFKPNYGASLQSLKVELGGDEDSGGGAEPTHMRSLTDQNYTRGYEWWLMQQAKLRNPNIKLQALAWGAPGWIGGGVYYSQDSINYIINFIQGAKNTYGLTIDCIGTLNESPYNDTWIKNLKTALIANGLTTKLVAADQSTGSGWYIANDLLSDSALMSAVDEIGEHYVGYSSTYNAKSTGKPLWASEDGPWRGDWTGAVKLAKIFNRNYIEGRITMTEIWSLVSSFYDVLPLAGSGLMYANTPWSGFFDVQPAIWAAAHTTQFAQPGWQYLDNSSGYLNNGGSYVTLKSGSDYSIVIEAADIGTPQLATFTVAGGLSTGTVHVWTTNATTQFVQQSDITPVNGSFTINLAAGSIYSLTTTTGQAKGNAAPANSSAFPFPYSETFDSYEVGKTVKYFSDIDGAYESAPCAAGRSGICLRQVVTTPPIPWGTAAPAEPASFVGPISWTNYQVSADVLLEQPGTAKLIGRLTEQNQSSGNVNAYQLYVSDTGAWSLRTGNFQVLTSGTVPFSLNSWHSMKLILNGTQIQGVIDGVVVTTFFDTTYSNGMAGLGVRGFTNAQFDNFRIDPIDGINLIPQAQITASATSQAIGYEASRAVDGNINTLWHTDYICSPGCQPAVPLPQSITLNLGGTYNISKLHYLPRQDGAGNGTITGYNIYVSPDGTNFTLVANGTWADDPTEKITLITPTSGSYVRLEALEGRAGYASASEINIEFGATGNPPSSPPPPPPSAPAITNLSPGSATAGGSGFTLTVTGSNFASGAVVRWNGSDRSTVFSSSTSLTASISATDIATASTATITVFNPGSATSSPQGFTVVAGSSGGGPAPGTGGFVVASTQGTLRNDYAGWVGMSITVSTAALEVSSLGRLALSGNAGNHSLKIVNAGTGLDVPGGAVSIGMGGSAPGNFVYGALPSPVTLSPNTTYYILSQETQGGDSWYDLNTTVQATGDAGLNGPVYGTSSPFAAVTGLTGHMYVPLDFKYGSSTSVHVSPTAASLLASQNQQFTADAPVSWTITPSIAGSISGTGLYTAPATIPSQQTVTVTATSLTDSTKSASAILTLLPAGADFVLSKALGTPRNDYSGWVWMSVAVGPAPLLVNSVGRIFAAGNTGSHMVKIVDAATGADLPGGAVAISMAGGTPGNFVYGALPSVVTLNPNATYYILSQETQNGDFWSDLNTTVQTTGDAALKAPVYGTASPFVTMPNQAGHTYVPVDFRYAVVSSPAPAPSPGSMNFVLSETTGTPRNNYAGWVGMSVTVGSVSLNVSSLGRIVLAGNTGSHVVKIVDAATGADLPQGAVTVGTAGAAPGSIVYAALPGLVTLNAYATYYILSQETQGGDSWCELNTSAQTRSDAFLNGPVYGTASPFVTTTGLAGHTYVPVDFQYTLSSAPAGPPPQVNFVLSNAPGTLRSDYSGWVGMSVHVGPSALVVNSIGRLFAAGNAGNHVLKIVDAGSGADVLGGTVTIGMAGGTPGSFVYGALASAVTLSPNTTYYVLSQETQGGDSWYDLNTTVQTTGDAALNAPVYGSASPFVTMSGLPGHMYVPLDFKYTVSR
jgi:hypothetical protein